MGGLAPHTHSDPPFIYREAWLGKPSFIIITMDGDDNVDHDDHIADCCDLVLFDQWSMHFSFSSCFQLGSFLSRKIQFSFFSKFLISFQKIETLPCRAPWCVNRVETRWGAAAKNSFTTTCTILETSFQQNARLHVLRFKILVSGGCFQH